MRIFERIACWTVGLLVVAVFAFCLLAECGPGSVMQNACGLIGHKYGPVQHGYLLNLNGGAGTPWDMRFCTRCGLSCDADWPPTP